MLAGRGVMCSAARCEGRRGEAGKNEEKGRKE